MTMVNSYVKNIILIPIQPPPPPPPHLLPPRTSNMIMLQLQRHGDTQRSSHSTLPPLNTPYQEQELNPSQDYYPSLVTCPTNLLSCT